MEKPINIHHAFQAILTKTVVPSDLNLPIIVNTQANYFVNVKGATDVMCTAFDPVKLPTPDLEPRDIEIKLLRARLEDVTDNHVKLHKADSPSIDVPEPPLLPS